MGLCLGIYLAARLCGNCDRTIPPEALQEIIQSGLPEQKTRPSSRDSLGAPSQRDV
jgi:hypothetical protein